LTESDHQTLSSEQQGLKLTQIKG